jgi:hypothetical protein
VSPPAQFPPEALPFMSNEANPDLRVRCLKGLP